MAIGDFNGDGKQDMAAADVNTNNVSVLLGDGVGGFAAAANFVVGSGPRSVAVGDFNGDGRQDLATANASSNNVSVLLGNGAGSFGAATNFAVGAGPVSVAVGDFNGDGKQDLAVTNVSANNVSVLLGDGAGGFGVATNFAVANLPFSVAVGDFNGDGKQDLAVGNQNSDTVSVLLGNGAGSFGAATNFGTASGPHSVAVGDFNGDGKQDLATANQNSGNNSVSVLLGDGVGSFSAATNFAVGTTPLSVAVGDFNGDGKQDLATANTGSSNVSVLLGDGVGAFSAATNFAVGTNPQSVAVGDFNGDGKQDLATANASSNDVSVLLRQCPTAAPGEISGHVSTTEGAPLAGVVIQLGGSENRRAITDANGNYRFDNVETGGFYTLTPTRGNYVFGPPLRSFNQLSENTEATFGATFTGDRENPLDTAEFFVRQNYLDFLNREPDQGGLDYWSNEIYSCNGAEACIRARRIGISAAFFVEQEFQQTGSFIYGLYKAGLGRQPSFAEFSIDRQRMPSGATLEEGKTALVESFVRRRGFLERYEASITADSFVDALLTTVRQSSGVDLTSERSRLIADYNSHGNLDESRSVVVSALSEHPAIQAAERNAAFVLTEYFGYLRRDPDPGGYHFWLDVLNNREPGNYRGMVCAFLTSAEYQNRFSSVVTRTNAECGK